ncbi:hypothetical protein MMC07_002605 [Pseudocyphellaria aurata]|nr:hypothetical protein [Pseudocyphellaria aurata]
MSIVPPLPHPASNAAAISRALASVHVAQGVSGMWDWSKAGVVIFIVTQPPWDAANVHINLLHLLYDILYASETAFALAAEATGICIVKLGHNLVPTVCQLTVAQHTFGIAMQRPYEHLASEYDLLFTLQPYEDHKPEHYRHALHCAVSSTELDAASMQELAGRPAKAKLSVWPGMVIQQCGEQANKARGETAPYCSV